MNLLLKLKEDFEKSTSYVTTKHDFYFNHDLNCFSTSYCLKKAGTLSMKAEELASDCASKFSSNVFELKQEKAFLNFSLKHEYFIEFLKQQFSLSQFARRVVVEYSSPNVGKPLHIGHIRSTIIGDSLKHLFRLHGNNVVSSNYLCEAGTQVATLLWSLQKFGFNESNPNELIEKYVLGNKEIEENPDYKPQVLEIVKEIEQGGGSYKELLDKVRARSIESFNEGYKKLNVSFDETLFDTDFIQKGKELVSEGLVNGLFSKDEGGEVFANLEDKGLPNLIVLRNNGTSLYSTRDLGLAELRFEKHSYDSCIIVTASEQNMHFKQVFKILELLGKDYSKNLQHIGYGLIKLPEGKMSSRKGIILTFQDVFDELRKEVLKKIEAKTYSFQEKEDISKAVAISALKFAILKSSFDKEIIFDVNKVTSFEGDTGPKLQYNLVRINSILDKASEVKDDFVLSSAEEELLTHCSLLESILLDCYENERIHPLCDYSLKLVDVFSKYYASNQVLNEPDVKLRTGRLKTIQKVKGSLELVLKVLNIPVLGKM
ncbi:Arginine--tRNA ligase [uncultured archaeon]|nr:Arginine--tRNA ligase [uncultured archaeon]